VSFVQALAIGLGILGVTFASASIKARSLTLVCRASPFACVIAAQAGLTVEVSIGVLIFGPGTKA
jgi:hypothetical protein